MTNVNPPDRQEILLHFQRKAYDVVYRMTGSAAEADGLTRKAFLRIFADIAPGADIEAWVYRTATSFAVEQLRRRPPPADPTGQADLDAVRRAFGRIPPEELQTLVLRMHEGLSLDRIGEILQTPPPTIRRRLTAARRKLETLLAPVLEGGAA